MEELRKDIASDVAQDVAHEGAQNIDSKAVQDATNEGAQDVAPGAVVKKKLWNKDFVLLLQAAVVSTLGDLMYSVAIGYWVYEKTGSSGLMGIMSSISMFITMFLSPITGSIIDKLNRKWVMIAMDLLQSGIMITVGILAFTDKLTVTGVLIAATLAAFGSVFYSPAANTVLLDIIPRDDMVRGQSSFQGATAFVNLVGSALSGLMVAFLGVPLIVVINGLSNLYSAISEIFIDVPKTIKEGTKFSPKTILHDTVTAIKTIFSDIHLRLFIPCLLIINLLAAGPITLMLPFTMEKGFSVDMYGYIMAIWTAASIVAVVVLGAIKFSSKARYWILALAFMGSEIFLILAYVSKSFIAVCIFVFIGALLNTAGNTIFSASLMLALPEENRGAILGFISSCSVGGSAISTVVYGLLGEICPLYIVFAIGSLISLIPMIYLCFNRITKKFIYEH